MISWNLLGRSSQVDHSRLAGRLFPLGNVRFGSVWESLKIVFYVFALSGLGLVPPGTVGSWEAPKPLIFIDFHWFSLIFIDFHWFSLISLISWNPLGRSSQVDNSRLAGRLFPSETYVSEASEKVWKYFFMFSRFLDSVGYHWVPQNLENHQIHWFSLDFIGFPRFWWFNEIL